MAMSTLQGFVSICFGPFQLFAESLKEMDNADPPLSIGIEPVFDYV
jgi:hypothetical protein